MFREILNIVGKEKLLVVEELFPPENILIE